MPAAHERLSGADRAWFRMATARNPMVIAGIWFFASPMSRERLTRCLHEKLIRHRRFRQRLVRRDGEYWWEEDPRFDLNWHLHTETLTPGAGEAELARLAERVMASPLPTTRPLWRFHLLERFGNASVLITRVHHCLGDGVAMMRVMQDLDDASDSRHSAPVPDGPVHASGAPTLAASDPAHAPSSVGGGRIRRPGRLLDDVLAIMLLRRDSNSCLRGRPGARKRVAWNSPTPLREWLSMARALGVSVNDLFAACLTGALRAYLLARKSCPRSIQLRAMVPVNLRFGDAEPDVGNHFGLVPLLLPVGEPDPWVRLVEVHRRMQSLKQGYQAPLAFLLLSLLGETPLALQRLVLGHLADRSTLVMSNVRGPDDALKIAGNRLERLLFWVPQAGDIGVGASVLSYRQQVQFGLMTDAKLCPDPQQIADAFAPEFERMLLALSMLPRGLRLSL